MLDDQPLTVQDAANIITAASDSRELRFLTSTTPFHSLPCTPQNTPFAHGHSQFIHAVALVGEDLGCNMMLALAKHDVVAAAHCIAEVAVHIVRHKRRPLADHSFVRTLIAGVRVGSELEAESPTLAIPPWAMGSTASSWAPCGNSGVERLKSVVDSCLVFLMYAMSPPPTPDFGEVTEMDEELCLGVTKAYRKWDPSSGVKKAMFLLIDACLWWHGGYCDYDPEIAAMGMERKGAGSHSDQYWPSSQMFSPDHA